MRTYWSIAGVVVVALVALWLRPVSATAQQGRGVEYGDLALNVGGSNALLDTFRTAREVIEVRKMPGVARAAGTTGEHDLAAALTALAAQGWEPVQVIDAAGPNDLRHLILRRTAR